MFALSFNIEEFFSKWTEKYFEDGKIAKQIMAVGYYVFL